MGKTDFCGGHLGFSAAILIFFRGPRAFWRKDDLMDIHAGFGAFMTK